MVQTRFSAGEEVMARWPGSSMWYKVQVLSHDEENGIYNVEYEDGTKLELEPSSIKKMLMFRTPRRSRSRSKSPARRSRSPGRRPRARSPIRSPKQKDEEVKNRKATKTAEEPVQTTTNHTDIKQAVTKVKKIKENNGAETAKQAVVPVKEKVTEEKKADAVATESSPFVIYRLRSRQHIHQAAEMTPLELPKLLSKPIEIIIAEPGLGEKLAAVCGSAGVALLPLALPLVLLYLLHVCRSDECSLLSPPALPPGLASLWDVCTLVLCLGWCLFQALLYRLPLGHVTDILSPNTEQQLKYRLNGIHALVLSIAAFSLAKYKEVNVGYVQDGFLQLAASAVLLAYLLSGYLFVRAGRAAYVDASATKHAAGNSIHDFCFGRELNPRIGNLDLKSLFVLRSGFIGWAIIGLIMILEDLKKNEAISSALLLSIALQFIYVADVLWNEERSLSKGDIAHSRCGFLLVFSGLAWTPFSSSLPAYYLVHHHHHKELTTYWTATIWLLYLVGFVIYRRAHSQTIAPSDDAAARGKAAKSWSWLLPGWWGRHPHLLGKLLMVLAWSLPCGLSHPLPYVPVAYSMAMLLHREVCG